MTLEAQRIHDCEILEKDLIFSQAVDCDIIYFLAYISIAKQICCKCRLCSVWSTPVIILFKNKLLFVL